MDDTDALLRVSETIWSRPAAASGVHGPEVVNAAAGVTIEAVVAPKISFAMHQNAVPTLRELRIVNAGADPLEDLTVTIAADPPVFAPREWRIDRIAGGGEAHVTGRDLQLDAGLLLGLNESVRAAVTFRARGADGMALAERSFPVELLARNEWGGAGASPELLAAFVMPNDPAVARLLKASSEVLRRGARPDAIEGYQSGSRTRVYELASAIWSAVSGLRLTYAEAPASFEAHGQKVRTPSVILDGGLATCLDTALLFAAALEQAGLNPVLVLTRGHAFAGVWLQPQEFSGVQVPDAAALRKRIALDELILFETTLATGAAPAGFARAIADGARRVDEAHEDEFVCGIDVARARMARIRPLAMADVASAGEATAPVDPAGDALEAAPALGAFDLAEPEAMPTTAEGRLERWQRKLLDLTTRNRLLNVKPGATALPLLCPDPARLEDLLADGKCFSIVGVPALDAGGRDKALHAERTGEALDEVYAADALDRGEIVSRDPADKLDAHLVELYRKARLDMAEGGANTLFLAAGFLVWRKSADDPRAYRAPLVLLPVKLERRSVRSGVKLSHHEDEPRFNLTLLQMLRQDFELEIPELAGALPTDDSGIDLPRIWTLVRRAVRDTPGFEVAPDVMLGTFSFAKYLMWRDLMDRTEALNAHPVVRHLLHTPREPYGACDRQPPRPETLDAEVEPADLFTPLPADSSQLAAVVGSAPGASGEGGCDFVLDGPPGTGKSQTIANMIAHNLALGRTVLFVAEKRAALDVVHRRLVAHGLGPFCLELHSNKASKAEVLKQLGAAWDAAEASPAETWARRAAELKASRDGLNRLVAALHTRRANGMTLYGAIGRAVRDGADALDGANRAIPLGWPDDRVHDEQAVEAMREAVRRLELHRPAGDAAAAFAHVGRTEWSNAWANALTVAAGALDVAAAELGRARDAFADVLGFATAGDARGLGATAALAEALAGAAGLNVGFAFAPDAARAIDAARAGAPMIAAYREDARGLSVTMGADAVRALPVASLEADWAAAVDAIWPLSGFRKKAVARRLDPDGAADPETDLPRLARMQAELARIDGLSGAAGVPGWAGVDTDVDSMAATLDAADALRGAMARAADTPDAMAALRKLCVDANDLLRPDSAVGRAGAAYHDAHRTFRERMDAFETLAEPPVPIDAPDLPAAARDIAKTLTANAGKLNPWTAWRRARAAACDLDLQPIVDALEARRVPPGGALAAFDLAYARWWAEATIDAEAPVRDFNLAEHTDAIARFRELDAQMATLTQSYIRAKLAGAIPDRDGREQPPGFGTLAHQLKLQKRHKPVRQLISEMGPALPTLAPCLLMSPLSVAQYLPPDAAMFDLVIFDEASQITPWDAVGAIARGRQLVVAGDPKQMPPSNNFGRSPGEDEDDGEVEADQESILEECLGARLPQRRLTWHYRSRHESLIAFSNHRYYGGDLITFPAPDRRETAVSLRPVAGAWSSGKARTNQPEAEAIVAEVVMRLTDPGFVDEAGGRLTLGVITMNAEQQRLIEDLLDRARRGRPELEAYFGEDAAEPVVVKNLETVQGDERDVILLGIGYGPATPGAPVMSMNFGPLNRGGGWRRLNVAITRARREMILFASFGPHMIDLNRTSAAAVRDLKHFMEYAERGPRALGEAVAGSVGGFESPFEEAVSAGLRSRGWIPVPQIGVSRFRIDLGIVHPDRPGDYLVGVECDGASYHSAATARDRDKVREGVLAGLGWTLVRVWSTDWWIDRNGALDRLDAALRAELERSRAKALANRAPDQATDQLVAADSPSIT